MRDVAARKGGDLRVPKVRFLQKEDRGLSATVGAEDVSLCCRTVSYVTLDHRQGSLHYQARAYDRDGVDWGFQCRRAVVHAHLARGDV